MAILTRNDIKKQIQEGHLLFDPPLDNFQMQPHAIDLRLGYRFFVPSSWELTDEGRRVREVAIDNAVSHQDQHEQIDLKPGQYFEILPGEFVIATSMEHMTLKASNLMATLFPRTSTNRRGLNLSLSGIIDAGYEGTLIFPIKNETSQVIRIYPGERVCQIVIEELSGDLTPEESQLHGLTRAKYSSTGVATHALDKTEERALLIAGDIDKLKSDYAL